MNRRGFLRGAIGAAAALAIGEAFLPKRSIFLPPAGGWPAGQLGSFRGVDYLTSPNAWFIKTGDEKGMKYFERHRVTDGCSLNCATHPGSRIHDHDEPAVLSAESLETLEGELRDCRLFIRPTKLITTPDNLEAYRRLLGA